MFGKIRGRIARVVKAKKPPMPRKPKPLPTVVIPAKVPKVKPPTHAAAKNLLAEHGKEFSAPTLAPDPAKPTPGQYKELDAVTKRLSRPASRRRSVHPPWIKPTPAATNPAAATGLGREIYRPHPADRRRAVVVYRTIQFTREDATPTKGEP